MKVAELARRGTEVVEAGTDKARSAVVGTSRRIETRKRKETLEPGARFWRNAHGCRQWGLRISPRHVGH